MIRPMRSGSAGNSGRAAHWLLTQVLESLIVELAVERDRFNAVCSHRRAAIVTGDPDPAAGR